MSWDQFPAETLIKIFSYVPAETLCGASAVNQYWNSCSNDSEPWKHVCLTFDIPLVKPYKEAYKTWFQKFRVCRDEYPMLYNLFTRFRRWMDETNFQVPLNPGATLQAVEASTSVIRTITSNPEFEFPKELLCWFLLVNGQEKKLPAFFGTKFFVREYLSKL